MTMLRLTTIAALSLGVVATANAAGLASSDNLEIGVGGGYTLLRNFDNSEHPDLKGWNATVGALLPLPFHDAVTPVLGVGAKYSTASGSRNGVDITFSSTSLQAHAGLKANMGASTSLALLGNFGYALSDKYKATAAGLEYSPTIKDHYNYGATLTGSYEVVANVNIGAALSYDWHQLKKDTDITSSVSDDSARYQEASANLTASLSL